MKNDLPKWANSWAKSEVTGEIIPCKYVDAFEILVDENDQRLPPSFHLYSPFHKLTIPVIVVMIVIISLVQWL